MQDGSLEPVAESPTRSQLMTAIGEYEGRSYKTYKARLVAHQRLRARNVAWNASLISTSSASTISAVGLLSDPGMYGVKGPTILTCLVVLTLVASLIVASMEYGSRTRGMDSNYKNIQRLSTSFQLMSMRGAEVSAAEFDRIRRAYDTAIEHSENHTTGDYRKSMKEKTRETRLDTIINVLPYLTLLIPVVILVPFVRWIF